jgi:predicted small metal-binding protein
MLRAVECPRPSCQHIHALNDEDLMRLVLQHVHQTHPEIRFGDDAAESLIDKSAYDDRKHSKRKGFVEQLGDTGGSGVWG